MPALRSKASNILAKALIWWLVKWSNVIRIRILIQAGGEFDQKFGGFFQIAVNQKDPVAAAVPDTGHQRLVVAEIAGEIQNPDAGIVFAQMQRDCKGVVRRAVIDEDDFKVVAGYGGGGGGRAPAEFRQPGGGTIETADD